MRKLFPAIIGLATALGIASACAQTYPSRPITLLVPFAAGGPADALARALGERMRASLGQTVIIENATGASGTIGVGRVVRAAPDGYTLGIGHVGTHVVNGAIYRAAVRPVEGSRTGRAAAEQLAPHHLEEGVSGERSQGTDCLAQGQPGQGVGGHRRGRRRVARQRRLFPEPHRHPLSVRALSRHRPGADRSDRGADRPDVRPGLQFARGRCAPARSRPTRSPPRRGSPSAPDIPTVDEAGLPGFYISTWYGLWAPKGTPKPVIAKLNAAVVEALADPAVQKRLGDLGLEVSAARAADAGGARRSPQGRRSRSGGRSSRRRTSRLNERARRIGAAHPAR